MVIMGLTDIARSSPEVDSHITALASASSCAQYHWRDRRRAPTGYIKGIALAYSRAYCELKHNTPSMVTVISSESTDKNADALELYFKSCGGPLDRLRSVYALAIGEGMRESSGNTTEGYDKTVRHPTAETAEAGLFQVSHDSIKGSPWLEKLISQYTNEPATCLLDVFREGVSDKKVPTIGTGPGADFQSMMKSCPALATNYAVVLFRLNRNHFGPIRRTEAELIPACEAMLQSIEKESDANCP
jgi:hypothetical protein